jgi:hypothetical protein
MVHTYDTARKLVAEIETRSKIAQNAYGLSSKDTDTLLDILKQWGNQEDGPWNPGLRAAMIFINVIDKNVAEKLKKFLESDPPLFLNTERLLRANLMRIAGF